MGLTFRTNEKDAAVHGCKDWETLFMLNPDKDPKDAPTFIRAYEKDDLRGQIGITKDHWIIFLAVDPNFRGHKIGTRLLHKAENYIRNHGGDLIQLHPQAEFEDKLIPWYQSEGYELVDFDPKCEEFIMQKRIGGNSKNEKVQSQQRLLKLLSEE